MFEVKFHTIIEDESGSTFKVNYYDTKGPNDSKNKKKGTNYTRTLLGSEQIFIPLGNTKDDVIAAVKERMKNLNNKNNLKYKDEDIFASL